MSATYKEEIERIGLAHGSGGSMTHRLISDVFLRYLDSPELALLDEVGCGNLGCTYSQNRYIWYFSMEYFSAPNYVVENSREIIVISCQSEVS